MQQSVPAPTPILLWRSFESSPFSPLRSDSSAMPFNSAGGNRGVRRLCLWHCFVRQQGILCRSLGSEVSISVCWGRRSPKASLRRDSDMPCHIVSYRVISCHAGWEIWMKSKFGGRFWAVRSWPSLKQLLQLCHPRMIGTRKEKCMHKILSSTSALHTGWTHRT